MSPDRNPVFSKTDHDQPSRQRPPHPFIGEFWMTIEYSIPVRVYYEDTNAGGVVYYANYLRFMERCRTEWLRHIGFDIRDVTRRFGLVFAVHTAALRYLKPARLSDLLSVSMQLERCGRASLDVAQAVRCEGELLCQGTLKLASLDAEHFRPQPIPTEILKGINTWKMP